MFRRCSGGGGAGPSSCGSTASCLWQILGGWRRHRFAILSGIRQHSREGCHRHLRYERWGGKEPMATMSREWGRMTPPLEPIPTGDMELVAAGPQIPRGGLTPSPITDHDSMRIARHQR
eukprot:gene12886-biopygen21520